MVSSLYHIVTTSQRHKVTNSQSHGCDILCQQSEECVPQVCDVKWSQDPKKWVERAGTRFAIPRTKKAPTDTTHPTPADERNLTMAYQFEPYDILQINRRGEGWQDYTTLRTKDEADYATRVYVNGRHVGESFRIVSMNKQVIKLTPETF